MTTKTDLDHDLIHRLRIDALVADYIHCIDEDRLEEWPDYFTADGRYKVITRENFDLGLPVALIRGANSDLLTRRTAAKMQAHHPEMIFAEVPDRAHIPFLDESESIVAVTEWLEMCR